MLKKITPSPKTKPKPLQSGGEIGLNDSNKSQRPPPITPRVPQIPADSPRRPSYNDIQGSVLKNTIPSPITTPKPLQPGAEKGQNDSNNGQRRPSPVIPQVPQIPTHIPEGPSYDDTQESISKNTTQSPITTPESLQSGGENGQINSNKDKRPLPLIPQVPQIPTDFPKASSYNATQDPENTNPSPKTTPRPLQSGGDRVQNNSSNGQIQPLPVIPEVPQIPADFPKGPSYNATQDSVYENTTQSPKTTPISALSGGDRGQNDSSNGQRQPLPVIQEVAQILADFPKGPSYNATQDAVLEHTTPLPKTTPISALSGGDRGKDGQGLLPVIPQPPQIPANFPRGPPYNVNQDSILKETSPSLQTTPIPIQSGGERGKNISDNGMQPLPVIPQVPQIPAEFFRGQSNNVIQSSELEKTTQSTLPVVPQVPQIPAEFFRGPSYSVAQDSELEKTSQSTLPVMPKVPQIPADFFRGPSYSVTQDSESEKTTQSSLQVIPIVPQIPVVFFRGPSYNDTQYKELEKSAQSTLPVIRQVPQIPTEFFKGPLP